MIDSRDSADDLDVVLFSSLLREPVRWLWPGRIPLGKVTVISGEAGLGKSLLTFDIAARVSRGGDWPDAVDFAVDPPTNEPGPGVAHGLPGRVLLLNADDHLADLVGPCLDAAGAVRERILAIRGMRSPGRQAGSPPPGIDLPRHLPRLRKQLELMKDVRLVVIDPLTAYCGRIGRYPTEANRRIATALAELAAEFHVALLVITDERHAGLPSRIAWSVQRDPFDADVRLWSASKFHYGAPPSGLGYRIQGHRIAWEPLPVWLTAEEIGSSGPLKKGIQRQQVIGDWLWQLLSTGPRESTEIYAAGETLGLSAKQVWRAKSKLQVRVSKVQGQFGKWIWELPSAPISQVNTAEGSPLAASEQ